MTEQYSTRALQRDSHDLSLSPRNVTRDSLVTNMLLSLDKFSGTQESTPAWHDQSAFDDYDARTQTWAGSCSPNGSSLRQNQHQYSYSSDYDDSSKLSSQNSRGRRSNSSSNFQATFARLNSARDSQRGPPTGSRGLHSRGGRGSKSSSSVSIDTGYSRTHLQRHNPGLGRSASFDSGPRAQQQGDQSYADAQAYMPSQSAPVAGPPASYHHHQASAPMSPFHVDFPGPEDAHAAPTPTVHKGPRREPSVRNVSRPPPPPPQPQPAPSLQLERKRSATRSLRSSAGARAQHGYESAPPVPAFDLGSAPAPHVGYGKSKEAGTDGRSVQNATGQTKDRPGFFRRVFGSSKSNSPSNSSLQSPTNQRFASSSDPSDGPSGSRPKSTQSKSVSAPPSRDASSQAHQPVLQKKPSSFFRRRKKSVAAGVPPLPSTETVPPVPPVSRIQTKVENEQQVDRAEPSPVSSLRMVMNPYLKSPDSSGAPAHWVSPLADITNTVLVQDEGRDGCREYKREFSPDYEPGPNARIRAVPQDADSTRPAQSPPLLRSGLKEGGKSFLNLDGASDDADEASCHDQNPLPKRDQTSASKRASASGSQKVEDPMATIRAKKRSPFTLESSDDSEHEPNRSTLALPIEGSPLSDSRPTSRGRANPADFLQPSSKHLATLDTIRPGQLDEPEFVVGDPTEDDLQKAKQIFDGDETFIQKEKAASWMGEEGPVRQRTLRAYMDLYDFSGRSTVAALRQVCGRLVFRAETQQVDRLLVAFSRRWCTCNPNHGFKASDVIHTICYSIMLLNTDLHLADIDQKMTRSQFVKNTLTTITQALLESTPDAFQRPSILPDKTHLSVENGAHDPKASRNSFRLQTRADAQGTAEGDDDCGPLVKQPFNGSQKAWEEQVEIVLKGIYHSIRDDRLPLFGADPGKHLPAAPSQSNSSLSVMGVLKRSPSVISKAPSESQISMRGRLADTTRNGASRWASKSRSRTGWGRNGFSSSRTSFEEDGSVWSPAQSSATWSRYSLGRTHTSVSQDSFGSSMPRGDYQQSIGFANALSQAIIRHEDATGHEKAASILSAEVPSSQLLDDESLELAGPPWIKEGIVAHKHHLDGVDKRAKDRNWSEVFAVVQKGQMSLFSFKNKTARQKSRTRVATRMPNAPVGGGNWQDNATIVRSFNLRHTLASALPPPGYSRTRPHVWALSLPTGAVHLFHVGTAELIKEFVTTVNYWSARLSSHPLVGGISNIEYGWSDSIVNNALVNAINESNAVGKTSRPGSAIGRRSSIQSGSLRSLSFDQGSGGFTNSRGKLPGDRIYITEWAPPTQSTRPSNATEREQLDNLETYVKGIEDELQCHNRLRSPMLLAFTPRGHNAAKAMANWERKSAYLLREIVKFRTYVDCLQQAETRKKEIHAERELARRAARGELMSDRDLEVSSEEEDGDETLKPE